MVLCIRNGNSLKKSKLIFDQFKKSEKGHAVIFENLCMCFPVANAAAHFFLDYPFNLHMIQ